MLAGIILSLLSQGYTTTQSAIQGSLLHALLAKSYTKNNYSLTPLKLIEAMGDIKQD